MRTTVNVNQHIIRANRREQRTDPVLRVIDAHGARYGHEAVIYGQDGKVAARVVYRPNKPFRGAHVWIETTGTVDVTTR